MTLFLFLTIIQAVVAAALVGVVLMQRSEGGGLGMGGSPSGMLSARGAADFLTRTTTILAILFVALSIVLAGLASNTGGGRQLDDTLQRTVPVGSGLPAGDSTSAEGAAAPATEEAPAADDPLAGAAE